MKMMSAVTETEPVVACYFLCAVYFGNTTRTYVSRRVSCALDKTPNLHPD